MLVVEDANNCTIQSDSICIEDERTSTIELQKSIEYKVFPNPSNDFINLELSIEKFKNFHDLKFEIISVSGQKVHVDITNHKKRIDVSKLKEGIYMLKIKTYKGSFFRKFIKYH